MKPKFTSLILILFSFIISTNLFGQSTLHGVVVDSLTQEALIGASVSIVGTALGSATNIEGEYRIVKIPAGNYNLRISYVGYKSKQILITIGKESVIKLSIQLQTDVIMGKELVISAQALGQAAAINQQINSNTIMNVVSEQKIQELPDVNAAEAIGRLPGVSIIRSGGEANRIILRGLSDKFTSFTIDGIKIASTDATSRGLDLSTISQSSLAGIELYKALTPDKDAEAIAGSVNLVTKKAPSERELTVIAKGNYNDLMNSFKQYDFSVKYGERFFDNLLGVQVNGNLEQKIRSSEKIDLDYDQTIVNQTDYVINNFTLEFTDELRTRKGFSFLFDYDTPDNGTIKLNTVFNSTKRDFMLHSRDYPTGGGTGGSVTYSYRDREQEMSTFNTALTGDNNLFDLKVNWGLSFAQSVAKFPYDYELDFLEASTNTSGMKANYPRVKTNPEVIIPFAWNNFASSTLYNAYYRTQNNLDKDKSAFLNLASNYSFDTWLTGELKGGLNYKAKTRTNANSERYAPYYLGYWRPYEQLDDGTIRAKDLNNTYFEDFFKRYQANPLINTLSLSEFLDSTPQSRNMYDLYNLYPLIDKDKLRQWYEINKNGVDKNGNGKEYYNDPSVNANSYDITESVTSTYLMNTLNIGQSVIFIAGVRIESENNNYKNKYSKVDFTGFPVPLDDTRDTTSSYTQTIVLPNFHVNIKATDFLNIRLAAYKSLARPDFTMRLNSFFAWRPSLVGSDRQLILGNPLLKTAEAWNFEINTSFYGNDIGLFSISAFYKEIDNMYHMLTQFNTSGNTMIESLGLNWKTIFPLTQTYQLTAPYNSPNPTKVWGFEIEHQINFSFLPGLLKNIVLSYNASLVKSETWLIGAVTDTVFVQVLPPPFPKTPTYVQRPVQLKQQLENQPKFYGNISLGYDIGGFSGRISMYTQAEYNSSYSPTGRGDAVVSGYTRYDLALKQVLSDNLSLILNLSNLSNIKEDRYINNRVNGYKILNTSELYGLTADFGVKITL
ncbi:MAG: TonB-dependent receptor [Ignavibacteriales bacterium]|nr:TonB-dependent receptor [Ignavibacteriales bacterium]